MYVHILDYMSIYSTTFLCLMYIYPCFYTQINLLYRKGKIISNCQKENIFFILRFQRIGFFREQKLVMRNRKCFYRDT